MDDMQNYLENVIKPSGVPTRTLQVDYRQGMNFYNIEITAINGVDDKAIIKAIFDMFPEYKVYSIYEVLDGYSYDEIGEMSSFEEAKMHMRQIYLDIEDYIKHAHIE